MFDTLKRFCALPGVSGDEGAVRGALRAVQADEVTEDALGSLIFFKRGARRASKKILLCAHMDEVGVMVTHITDEGYLKFACVGGIDRRVLPGKTVWFGDKAGIIGTRPIHLVKAADRDTVPTVEDLYIDIGATSREEAQARVAVGDAGSFDPEILAFGDGYIKAKAIDDRFGCAVLYKLLQADLPVDTYFAFTVQEEVGTRGAQIAAFRVEPDIALILEATTAADLPGVSDAKTVCKLGGGAVAPFMDGGTIYHRELWELLTQTAEAHNIPWQTKQYISGGTDAAAVQRSRAGVATVALSAPVRNLHSPACVAKISDLEAVFNLTTAFLDKLGERYGV